MRSEKPAGVGRLPLLVVVQFSVTTSPGAQPLAGSTATPDTDRSMKGASADWQAKVASLLVSAVPDAFSSATALATRSEEHTSELQSLMRISYAVFCLQNTRIPLHDTNQTLTTQ